MAAIAGEGQQAPLLVVADIEEFGQRQRLGRLVSDHMPQSGCPSAPPERGHLIIL